MQDLVNDLTADGWWVHRHDVPGSLAVPRCEGLADAHRGRRLPVGAYRRSYSGNLNPDGHAEHPGAWAWMRSMVTWTACGRTYR